MTLANIDYKVLQQAVKHYSLCAANGKKDVLVTAIISDLQNGNIDYLSTFPQIADLYFCEILTLEDLNSDLVRVLKSLPLPSTHNQIKKLKSEFLANLNANANASNIETSARKQVTTQSVNNDRVVTPEKHTRQNNRLTNKPVKTASKLAPIGVNSTTLQRQFRELGFLDQNGHSYLGDYAARVLSECWDDERLQPSAEIKAYGYYTQAIVHIQPEQKETINGQLRDQKIPNTPTVYNNSRSKQAGVKVNSINHGNAIPSYDLVPLLRSVESHDSRGLSYATGDSYVNTDLILSVDWQVEKVTIHKPQDISKSSVTGRSKPVKQKITWGTRFLPVEIPQNVSLGENIKIKLGNGKTIEARLVLEASSQINLYRDGDLWVYAGKWSQQYDQDNNLILTGVWSKDIPASWYKKLNGVISRIVASNSTAIRQRFDFSADTYRVYDATIKLGKALNAKKRKRIKTQAKKYVHKQLEKDHKVPLDIVRALEVLNSGSYDPAIQKYLKMNEIPNSLDSDTVERLRNKANDLVIGYYLYSRPTPQKHSIQAKKL